MAWAKFITEEFGQSFHPLPYPCPNVAGFLKYHSKTKEDFTDDFPKDSKITAQNFLISAKGKQKVAGTK